MEQLGNGADWLPHSENKSASTVTQLAISSNTLHTMPCPVFEDHKLLDRTVPSIFHVTLFHLVERSNNVFLIPAKFHTNLIKNILTIITNPIVTSKTSSCQKVPSFGGCRVCINGELKLTLLYRLLGTMSSYCHQTFTIIRRHIDYYCVQI